MHDRATGVTTRVSVANDGSQANDASAEVSRPAISGNGRFVAFHSTATNLVPDDTNGVADIFLRDLWTNTTELVSVAQNGGFADDASVGDLSMNADGRFVAWGSAASNLVPGDTNDRQDTFVRDRQRGRTPLVSVASDGTQGNGDTQHQGTWISGDGRFVSFDETATNLVPNDTNNAPDTFVHDRSTGRTERVSVTSDGTQADSYNGNHLISGDGRYVAFGTVSSNLFPNDTNGYDYDIVVSAVLRPVIDSVRHTRVSLGTSRTLTIRGAWFAADAVVTLGDGITVRAVRLANPTTLKVTIDLSTTAARGRRSVYLANPGTGPGDAAGAATVCRDCINVR